jgi:uncharacterized protein YehS (DUF1456 family)
MQPGKMSILSGRKGNEENSLALLSIAIYSKATMTQNDIVRRVRYALNLNDPTLLEIFKQGDHAVDLAGIKNLLKKEDEPGYAACSDKALGAFLDGLIIQKRGKKETEPGQVKKQDAPLTNNAILKKLRIALELKEDDMLAVLKQGSVEISSSELSAFFRKQGHKHYKECGDQFLRGFLKGLAIRYRGSSAAE